MDPRKKRVRVMVFISILVHMAIFFMLNVAVEWKIIGINRGLIDSLDQEPIVFDLQQPKRPREVIETPQNARTVPEQKEANFLSDKNARARNPEIPPHLKEGEAFSRGDFESHEFADSEPKQDAPSPEKSEEIQHDPFSEIKKEMEKYNAGVFYKDYIFKERDPKDPGKQDRIPNVKHDHRDSRSSEQGGLSFNTYDWNFAPYMLMLKQRIQGNIYPPIAFTRLGMISGETWLRFRIYPNGELRNLEVLKFQGDESLMKTSRIAVEISAPFPHLPPDFPESFLVVTGRFMYLIRLPEKKGE